MERLAALGVQKLTYSGGEPVLDPGLPAALKAGKDANFEQVVTSNGDVLARRVPTFLELATYVKLSFYGAEETHDAIMGAGHFRRLLLASEKLADAGITVGANYMLSRRSEHEVIFFLESLQASPITNVALLTYIPTTWNSATNAEFQLLSEANSIAHLLQQLQSTETTYGGKVKVHNYGGDMFYIILEEDLRLVMPDGSQEFVMGGLFDQWLTLPGRGLMPAAQALEEVWVTRFATSAITSIGE